VRGEFERGLPLI